jgi:hypothetical protein
MLQIKAVPASEVKIGDRIVDPVVIKPYLTEEGCLPDELAEASFPVLAVGVFKDVDANKRNEILKNADYSMDTVIIMVRVPGGIPEPFNKFLHNDTLNYFYVPSQSVTILL